MTAAEQAFDFIVVGSGAGGGVLAARLARNNQNLKVLLIEAGGKPDASPYSPGTGFHALASEDAAIRWDYFVDHFTDRALAAQDEKWQDRKAIFYPRSSALGGCTAHHAMITVYPDPTDWDGIANVTGDVSWSSEVMWKYFERCCSTPGYSWLPISAAGLPTLLEGARDDKLRSILLEAIKAAPHLAHGLLDAAAAVVEVIAGAAPDPVLGDTNNLRHINDDREGLYRIPLNVKDGRRAGVLELLQATAEHETFKSNLTIWTDCLVTRVLLNDERATGVEYLPRPRTYRADRDPDVGDMRSWDEAAKELRTVNARREVILAAGAFNTPQLLMLSGIGPADHLRTNGIPLHSDLPGVGQKLRDRYEIAVIDDLGQEFEVLQGYNFVADASDPGYLQWKDGRGLYTTNGGTLAIMKRSAQSPGQELRPVHLFGIPSEFAELLAGLFKEYSNDRGPQPDFSWVILKGAHREHGIRPLVLG